MLVAPSLDRPAASDACALPLLDELLVLVVDSDGLAGYVIMTLSVPT